MKDDKDDKDMGDVQDAKGMGDIRDLKAGLMMQLS